MKAKIGSVEVEGTPEEVSALIRSLQPDSPASIVPAEPAASGRAYVSEEIAFRVLKRRQLSKEQSAMLSLLRKNHPSWTTSIDIQRVTKYKPNQLSGLFGAFGKRVSSTDGYVPDTRFFDQEWDYEQDCYRYRLPDGVHAAVLRAGL